MECRDVLEAAVARLSGELPAEQEKELERHLAECRTCPREIAGLEETWKLLGTDADAQPTAAFRNRTLERLEAETLRRRVAAFRPRRTVRILFQAAALLTAAAAGFLLSRFGGAREPARVVASRQEPSLPDLSKNPRLANVSYHAPDAEGRIGVSFDVTRRYTVVGKPDQKPVGDLLAYLVSGAAETEGSRGKAIDLVAQNYALGAAPSPQVVAVLADTLKHDKNPGVRKKAAEALSQLPPTPEIRDALVAALRSDPNPAIRIIAVEGLEKAASTLRDAATIETLREKASDEKESGYVRVKAASALKRIDL
jgi:hypothetical protein